MVWAKHCHLLMTLDSYFMYYRNVFIKLRPVDAVQVRSIYKADIRLYLDKVLWVNTAKCLNIIWASGCSSNKVNLQSMHKAIDIVPWAMPDSWWTNSTQRPSSRSRTTARRATCTRAFRRLELCCFRRPHQRNTRRYHQVDNVINFHLIWYHASWAMLVQTKLLRRTYV